MDRRPNPPDPLLATLLEEASRTDVGDLDLEAICEIVDAAVAPFDGVLAPEALDDARTVAAVALLSAPGAAEKVARHREASGTRTKQSPERLLDAARRRRNGSGGRGAS